MAKTDPKSLAELELYNNSLNENSIVPITVNQSGSNVTRRVYFPTLKTQIAGYELTGVLTAGSTSVTLQSVGTTYNQQNAYNVGDLVTYTGADEVVRNYICIKACTAANWETNGRYFAEYTPISANSKIAVYTRVGNNPYVLTSEPTVTLTNNAITLEFTAQADDILIKVVVS